MILHSEVITHISKTWCHSISPVIELSYPQRPDNSADSPAFYQGRGQLLRLIRVVFQLVKKDTEICGPSA